MGFADGRQIVGFSEDVDGGEQGFFLVPPTPARTPPGYYVFQHAMRVNQRRLNVSAFRGAVPVTSPR